MLLRAEGPQKQTALCAVGHKSSSCDGLFLHELAQGPSQRTSFEADWRKSFQSDCYRRNPLGTFLKTF